MSKHLPYLENGRRMDERPMESWDIKVIFYSFYLNKSANKATIEGRIFAPNNEGDSDGIGNYIFLATPVGNKLTKIRIFKPSYQRKKNDPHEDKFPFRTGDFKLEFKFNDKERLYFNSEFTFPLEFDIGKLLSSN